MGPGCSSPLGRVTQDWGLQEVRGSSVLEHLRSPPPVPEEAEGTPCFPLPFVREPLRVARIYGRAHKGDSGS